jgi:hypothetical protein
MPISEGNALERVARVLCGQRLSANANGTYPSAGDAVDAAWRDYVDDAIAVLKTLREPDAAMAAVGDASVWEAMVHAALGDEPFKKPALNVSPSPNTGSLHQGP